MKRSKKLLLYLFTMFALFTVFCGTAVYAEKYDFSYESVYVGKEYYKDHRRVQMVRVANYNKLFMYSDINAGQNGMTAYYVGGTAYTNGKKVYYVIRGSGAVSSAIYCYDFGLDTSKKLAELSVYDIAACNGKYLFYLVDNDGEFPLYRYSISTGKTKKLLDDAFIHQYGNGKYLAWREPGDFPTNVSIYIMNKNGNNVKKICTAMNAVIYKKKVYYKKCVSYQRWCCESNHISL